MHIECLQQRSYAIMSRAKHRAGLPVESPVKASAAAAKKKAAPITKANSSKGSSKWRTTGYFNKQHEHADEETTRALLKRRLENMNFRKPASINERLIKVQQQRDVIQPENPHLLKVAVIGAANAGKSTLINKIVGEEVSLVFDRFTMRFLMQRQQRCLVYRLKHTPQGNEFWLFILREITRLCSWIHRV